MSDTAEGGQKVLYLCLSVFLVLMAGLMSGLTLGLMSLDQVDLEVGMLQSRFHCRKLRDQPVRAQVTCIAGFDSQRHSNGEKVCSTHLTGMRTCTTRQTLCCGLERVTISQVVSKPHHTLVTLLLCNAVALEVCPQKLSGANRQSRQCLSVTLHF